MPDHGTIRWGVLFACVGAIAAMAFAAGHAAAQPPAPASQVAMGRALAFNRTKGNCLACHTMKGGDVPSNVGPALSDMKARFPDRKALFAMLWDEESRNPQTAMPAFGKNLILNAREINQIIDFLYTL